MRTDVRYPVVCLARTIASNTRRRSGSISFIRRGNTLTPCVSRPQKRHSSHMRPDPARRRSDEWSHHSCATRLTSDATIGREFVFSAICTSPAQVRCRSLSSESATFACGSHLSGRLSSTSGPKSDVRWRDAVLVFCAKRGGGRRRR
jgi:hypothetical protein